MADSSHLARASTPKHPDLVRDKLVWLVYAMLGYSGYLLATLGPLMPFLRAEQGISHTTAAMHFSCFAMGVVFGGMTGEYLLRKLGLSFVFWGGAAGLTLSCIGLTLSHLPMLSMASAGLIGYLGNMMGQAGLAGLINRTGEGRAIALTEANIVSSFFAMIAPLVVSGFQRTGLGWRFAIVIGIFAFVGLVTCMRHGIAEPRNKAQVEQEFSHPKLPLTFWLYLTVIFLSVSVEWSMVVWSPEFLMRRVGLCATDASSAVSAFLVAMLAGRIIVSRLLRTIPADRLLIGAVIVSIFGFLIFWQGAIAPINLFGLFVSGLGVSGLYPLTYTSVLEILPHHATIVSSKVAVSAGCAILVVPLTLGWVADRVNIATAYGVVAVLLFIAAVMIVGTTRKQLRALKSALVTE